MSLFVSWITFGHFVIKYIKKERGKQNNISKSKATSIKAVSGF